MLPVMEWYTAITSKLAIELDPNFGIYILYQAYGFCWLWTPCALLTVHKETILVKQIVILKQEQPSSVLP